MGNSAFVAQSTKPVKGGLLSESEQEQELIKYAMEAARLYDDGVFPGSEQGQDFAERFWGCLMNLTGGDANMLQKMNEQYSKNTPGDDETSKKSQLFMGESLEIYFNGPKSKANNGG